VTKSVALLVCCCLVITKGAAKLELLSVKPSPQPDAFSEAVSGYLFEKLAV
jgi:hypothetical protein